MLWFVHPGKPANLREGHPNLSGDVTPGSNKAYLTLDDGRRIILDTTSNGELAQQGSMQIEKKDGQVSYAVYNGASTDEVLYNKVTVPNGGDVVPLELGDGSKVWLNAGSTISYPVSFDKAERKVEITGEAYFEVAGSADEKVTPFVVSKGDLVVTVLGTRFNVNGYANEDDFKVTLLDGSAKVQYRQSARIIKAGEQAIISNARISVTDSADLEQAVAWKNGIFQFNNANIKLIMRQMERWYDLTPTRYENQTDKNLNFSGAISRYNNASEVLKLLAKTGVVHFKIEGKKIIVTQ